LKLDPIILPENFTFPNFTLQISNISSSDNSSTSCSFLNRVNFIVKFNCRKKLGRILTAKMIFISNGNMTLEVGNFSATGNRLTTNNNSEVDNLVNIKAKLKCTNLSFQGARQNLYRLSSGARQRQIVGLSICRACQQQMSGLSTANCRVVYLSGLSTADVGPVDSKLSGCLVVGPVNGELSGFLVVGLVEGRCRAC
jgi:hypothetical protein